MNDTVKMLIEFNIDLIEQNDFEELFNKCVSFKTKNELVEVLLQCKIDFLSHLYQIDEFMFMNCTADKIVIPNNIIKIGNGAFFNCENLIQVVIPSSVKVVGYRAFNKCHKLYQVIYEGTKEELGYIELYQITFEETKVKVIHCSDGDVNVEELAYDAHS